MKMIEVVLCIIVFVFVFIIVPWSLMELFDRLLKDWNRQSPISEVARRQKQIVVLQPIINSIIVGLTLFLFCRLCWMVL